ncbi:MAG: hypothetical protein ACR2PT_03310 [Endozoicomonas sp.]
MTFLIKNIEFKDIYTVRGFNIGAVKVDLIPSNDSDPSIEVSMNCRDSRLSFWCLLSNALTGRIKEGNVLAVDQQILPELMQLMDVQEVNDAPYKVIKLIFSSFTESIWTIRILMRANVRLLCRKDLVGVQILNNGLLHVLIIPENDRVFVKAMSDPRIQLMQFPPCIKSREEISATGQQPPPQPPGAGAQLIFTQQPVNPVHFLDPATGQVFPLE